MQVPREGLVQKLQRLSASQQSIESVSSFCIFYHKDARGVVQIWDQEFYKATPERRLALLFLANHILQEGRKKGMSFQEEFFKVLPKALGFVAQQGDDKTRKQAARLVAVWEERRVFGTKHIKSFRDVIGPNSKDGSDTRSSSSKAAAAAAAGGSSAAAAATVADLGPVGEVLAKVNSCAATAATRSKEFNLSWSQGTMSTAGLPEVTAAHTQLSAYCGALTEELEARQAAVRALAAETARQTTEISRLQSQLQSAGGQRQQLEQQMATLTQQMASAVASLGQVLQQQQNGSAAAAATEPEPEGSPEAPSLLLEDDEDEEQQQPVLPAAAAASTAAAAVAPPPPGIYGGPLGGLMQQNPLQQGPQQQQQQQQPMPQPPVSQPLSGGLAALLGNPEMLSAAILGGAAAGGTGLSAPAAAAGGAVGTAASMPMSLGASGEMDVGGSLLGGAGLSGFGGFGELGGTFSAGFGALGSAGFADEGEDPYDPLAEG